MATPTAPLSESESCCATCAAAHPASYRPDGQAHVIRIGADGAARTLAVVERWWCQRDPGCREICRGEQVCDHWSPRP